MDRYNRAAASKTLSRLELNNTEKWLDFNSLWCRIAGLQKEKWDTNTHFHSFFELHLCLNGCANIVLSENSAILESGHFLLISPETDHHFSETSKDYVELVWGIAPKTEETLFLLQSCCSHNSQRFPEEIRYEVDQILHTAFDVLPVSQNIIRCRQEIILLSLIQMFSAGLGSFIPTQKKIVHLSNIRQYIVSNLEARPSADEAAAHFFISRRQLTRICNREAGCGYQALKRSLQIQLLKELIEEGNVDFDAMAAKAGFSNRFSMSKAFKQAEGLPPGKYREAFLK